MGGDRTPGGSPPYPQERRFGSRDGATYQDPLSSVCQNTGLRCCRLSTSLRTLLRHRNDSTSVFSAQVMHRTSESLYGTPGLLFHEIARHRPMLSHHSALTIGPP